MGGADRYGKLAKAGSYLPPLGLAYLAATVEKDHEVVILDGSIMPLTMEDIRAKLTAMRPEIVGVTALTPTFYKAVEVCRAAKEILPGCLTVLGGPHPSSAPEESIADPAVDAVAIGEGEETFAELVRTRAEGGDLATVAGLLVRKGGEAVKTPPRAAISDLDSIPFPARRLLPMELYRPSPLHYRNLPAFSIMCGRGCPFKCTFCSCSKVFPGKSRLRSVDNVMAEVEMLLRDYGAREILVWDDLFGLKKDWVREFCERIEPLKLTWSAWMRVDVVDPDTLKRMAKAGCWNISFGIEAGNQAVLDSIKKGIKVGEVKKAFRETRAAGIEARGTFILGLPGETVETIRETVDLAIAIKADYAQFQYLTPYPGSEIWKSTGDARAASPDLSKYTIWFPVYLPEGFTEEKLKTEVARAYRRFYFRPGYILQRLSKIRTWDDVKRHLIGAAGVLNLVSKK